MLGEVLTAIVTPFDREGRVDLDRFSELATFLVEHGSDGIVVCGTTGESPTLGDAEKLTLWEAAADLLRGRATVIAGTGTYDTAHSAELTSRAHELGVDGFLVVTPYYNKPPQRGIVRHVEEIAARTDKPVVVYNIPTRVVIDIEPATMARLAEIENVTAVKQAHDDLDEARFIAEETGLDLYCGDDNITLTFLRLGGVGVITVIGHVWGAQIKEMIRRHREGDDDGAREIDEQLGPAYELLKIATNPIPIKTALNLLGHDVGGFRLPLVDATPDEAEQVRSCLERGGVLAHA